MSYHDDGLGAAILDALGMDKTNATAFTLTCDVRRPSSITVDYLVMPGKDGWHVPISQTYRITPIDDEEQA